MSQICRGRRHRERERERKRKDLSVKMPIQNVISSILLTILPPQKEDYGMTFGSISVKYRDNDIDAPYANPAIKGVQEFMLYPSIVHEAKHFSTGLTKMPLPLTVGGMFGWKLSFLFVLPVTDCSIIYLSRVQKQDLRVGEVCRRNACPSPGGRC